MPPSQSDAPPKPQAVQTQTTPVNRGALQTSGAQPTQTQTTNVPLQDPDMPYPGKLAPTPPQQVNPGNPNEMPYQGKQPLSMVNMSSIQALATVASNAPTPPPVTPIPNIAAINELKGMIGSDFTKLNLPSGAIITGVTVTNIGNGPNYSVTYYTSEQAKAIANYNAEYPTLLANFKAGFANMTTALYPADRTVSSVQFNPNTKNFLITYQLPQPKPVVEPNVPVGMFSSAVFKNTQGEMEQNPTYQSMRNAITGTTQYETFTGKDWTPQQKMTYLTTHPLAQGLHVTTESPAQRQSEAIIELATATIIVTPFVAPLIGVSAVSIVTGEVLSVGINQVAKGIQGGGLLSTQEVAVSAAEGGLFSLVGGKVIDVAGLTEKGLAQSAGRIFVNTSLGAGMGTVQEAVQTGKVTGQGTLQGGGFGLAFGVAGEFAGYFGGKINAKYDVTGKIDAGMGKMKEMLSTIGPDQLEQMTQTRLLRPGLNQVEIYNQNVSVDEYLTSVKDIGTPELNADTMNANFKVKPLDTTTQYVDYANSRINEVVGQKGGSPVDIESRISEVMNERADWLKTQQNPSSFKIGINDELPSNVKSDYLIKQPQQTNLNLSDQIQISGRNTFDVSQASTRLDNLLNESPDRFSYGDYKAIVGQGKTITATRTAPTIVNPSQLADIESMLKPTAANPILATSEYEPPAKANPTSNARLVPFPKENNVFISSSGRMTSLLQGNISPIMLNIINRRTMTPTDIASATAKINLATGNPSKQQTGYTEDVAQAIGIPEISVSPKPFVTASTRISVTTPTTITPSLVPLVDTSTTTKNAISTDVTTGQGTKPQYYFPQLGGIKVPEFGGNRGENPMFEGIFSRKRKYPVKTPEEFFSI